MRILVVDDEVVVRDVTAKLLARLGHEATAVSSGADALVAYRDGAFDLVILDLLMPNMSGEQCLEALLQLDPSAKVVMASGLATEAAKRLHGSIATLPKPYQLSDLRRVLDLA